MSGPHVCPFKAQARAMGVFYHGKQSEGAESPTIATPEPARELTIADLQRINLAELKRNVRLLKKLSLK